MTVPGSDQALASVSQVAVKMNEDPWTLCFAVNMSGVGLGKAAPVNGRTEAEQPTL